MEKMAVGKYELCHTGLLKQIIFIGTAFDVNTLIIKIMKSTLKVELRKLEE